LLILSVGAIAAGFIPFGKFISSDSIPMESHVDLSFSALPVSLSVFGIIAAFYFFAHENYRAERWSHALGGFFRAAKQKFYIDEIYLFITKKIIFNLVAKPAAWIDRNIVDGFVNMLGKVTEVFSVSTSILQSGKIQSYSYWMLAGVIGLLLSSFFHVFIYLMK
jgi:NADH-quinone oxidoreductase subunit L